MNDGLVSGVGYGRKVRGAQPKLTENRKSGHERNGACVEDSCEVTEFSERRDVVPLGGGAGRDRTAE